MQQILETINGIRDSESNIFFTGETGVGKSLLAKIVHFTSRRQERPFLSINCATLTEELLASELFGHERGAFTGGFEHWDQVEGELLRFIIAGPLHWLGILDLSFARPGSSEATPPLAASRFSSWSTALLEGAAPAMAATEWGSLVVRSNGVIHAQPGTPRAGRYQVARFCEWLGEKDGVYRYRITQAGLQKASRPGLKVEHILGILQRYAKAVPPSLVQALRRWEAHGSPARLEQLDVLRVKDPELLKSLRSS